MCNDSRPQAPDFIDRSDEPIGSQDFARVVVRQFQLHRDRAVGALDDPGQNATRRKCSRYEIEINGDLMLSSPRRPSRTIRIVFGREVSPGCPADIFHNMLGRPLAAVRLRVHVCSFAYDENLILLNLHHQFCATGDDPGYAIGQHGNSGGICTNAAKLPLGQKPGPKKRKTSRGAGFLQMIWKLSATLSGETETPGKAIQAGMVLSSKARTAV